MKAGKSRPRTMPRTFQDESKYRTRDSRFVTMNCAIGKNMLQHWGRIKLDWLRVVCSDPAGHHHRPEIFTCLLVT
ncbi:unnamed protein product [Arabis nemorensis]|uniref:Uncharacterized protein n=1 Tax=Arabis nemorensis TaxID=586526 RepID=A0A565BTW0_9BRAS|nr:unnamed protein product [Arabis nemorensis]